MESQGPLWSVLLLLCLVLCAAAAHSEKAPNVQSALVPLVAAAAVTDGTGGNSEGSQVAALVKDNSQVASPKSRALTIRAPQITAIKPNRRALYSLFVAKPRAAVTPKKPKLPVPTLPKAGCKATGRMGTRVTVYKNTDFTGASQTYTPSSPNGGCTNLRPGLAGQVKSIKVDWNVLGPDADSVCGRVIFYIRGYCQGRGALLEIWGGWSISNAKQWYQSAQYTLPPLDLNKFQSFGCRSSTQTGPPALIPAPLSQQFLDGHNRVRAAVRVPNLAWNDGLAMMAQMLADQLAGQGCVLQPTASGQNLASSSTAMEPQQMVAWWASERCRYTKSGVWPLGCASPTHWDCAQYIQIVWRATTTVGCGKASCGAGTVGVCMYNPTGGVYNQIPY